LSVNILQHFTVNLSEIGLAPNTIAGILSVLKLSLNKAVALGIAEKQFASSIQRPKSHEKKIECFTKEEQRKIENYILSGNKDTLFGITLCLYTGLRIGELLALRWSDMDFEKSIVTVTKSCHDEWKNGRYKKVIDTPKTANSARVIPVPKQLVGRLKAIKKRAKGDFVICGINKNGVKVRCYQESYYRILRKLNIPHKGFHSLRHTFATRAIEIGMDVKTLSELMGHSNPTVTLKRYAHSLLEHKTEMMNRLGKLLG